MSNFEVKTDEELYEILGSVKNFNIFISNLTEHILRKVMISVPDLVIHHIKNEQSYKIIKEKFFTDNPELVNYKPVVAQCLNEVAAEHPDWGIEQVFVESGIRSKKTIRTFLAEEKKNGEGV